MSPLPHLPCVHTHHQQGKKKKGGLTEQKPLARYRAILDLKNQRDNLHRYQRRIEVLTARETEIARQMAASGNRARALLALRRKKYQEQLLSKTDAQLAQLEQLTRSVEFALIQKDVVFGLQQGTRVLQDIHREMGGLEHVEKLMGDSADAIAYQREVSEMLGGRITNQDEDEVEYELAALEAEVNANASANSPAAARGRVRPRVSTPPTVLPSAPDRPLPKAEAEEEEEEEDAVPIEQEREPRKAQPERRAMLAS